jgi:hypothetical protein
MAPTRRLGRPRLFDDRATTRISLAVTPAQRLELQRVATENRTQVSAVIRDAVNEFVADYGERQPFPPTRRRSPA